MKSVMPFLLAGLMAGAAGADVVGLQWPENRVQQALFAYHASSLMPVKPTAARPTLEQRLAAPPFVTGEGRVGLELDHFDATTAAAIKAVAAQAGAGANVTFATFSPAAEKLYGPHRAPATLAELKKQHGIQEGADWAFVDVMSLLTKNRRRIWYNARTVLEASVAAMESGNPLSYPVGTWFLSEQFHADGVLTEFHILGKREDHEIDYLLYDKDGKLGIQSCESNMRAPTTCFACHRNARRLTPFAEFPGPASTVAGFTPEVMLTLTDLEKEIARGFVITGPRPDDTHGTYGGLAAIRLKAQMAGGSAPAWGKALWPRLVKLVPALAR